MPSAKFACRADGSLGAPSPPVGFSFQDGVATIQLTNPPHNALDLATARSALTAVARAGGTPGLRAVLVCGQGPDLSLGGDLALLGDHVEDLPDLLAAMTSVWNRVVAGLAGLEAPVVCAASGSVVGGALGLLWASDLVIAGDDLRLRLGFANLGLSGDGGSSWFLPRLVGLHRALNLTMGNRVLNATEALDLGLVSQVVAAGEVASVAAAAASELAAGPTVALARIRQTYRAHQQATLAEALDMETESMAATGATADAAAGIGAFLERRPPRFAGS